MLLNKVWAKEFADKVSVRENKLGPLLTCYCFRVQIFCELLQPVDWRREENQHYSRLLAKTISTSTVLIVFTTIYRELCNGSCSQDSQWDLYINYEVLHVQHMLYAVLWWLNFSTVSTVVWLFALPFSVFLSCGLLLYLNFPLGHHQVHFIITESYIIAIVFILRVSTYTCVPVAFKACVEDE